MMEFNEKEARNTSTPNNDRNDEEEQKVKLESGEAVTKSPHTPLDNGQSKSGKSGGPEEEAVAGNGY